ARPRRPERPMWKGIRAQFDPADLIVVGFHGLAILLLAPFYDALPEWSEATVQSALVVAGTFIVATRVAPVNIKIATLLRIMLAIASTVWGYERARAIIGLTWGTPSLEGYFINADIAV